MMIYFKNNDGAVFGYDDQDPAQADLIAAATKAGWQDVTANWPPPLSLDDAKAEQLAVINAAFSEALAVGKGTSLGFKMDATLEALQKLKTAYDFAVLMSDATMAVVDYDNSAHVNVPIADVEKILKEVGGNYRSLYMTKQQLRGQVLAATTPEQVASVVWPHVVVL